MTGTPFAFPTYLIQIYTLRNTLGRETLFFMQTVLGIDNFEKDEKLPNWGRE